MREKRSFHIPPLNFNSALSKRKKSLLCPPIEPINVATIYLISAAFTADSGAAAASAKFDHKTHYDLYNTRAKKWVEEEIAERKFRNQ